MARIFDSEIYINKRDEWIFRGNQITKEEIIQYFRSNLQVSEMGVYILNTFGELSENGYLKIDGYPCHVLHVELENENLLFYANDGKVIPFGEFEIYESKEGGIIGFCPDREKIKYRFNWNAAKDLSKFLEDQNGITHLHLNGNFIPIPIYKGEIHVPLPKEY